MLTREKTLTFHKENDGHWYLESQEYEDEMTKEFRATRKYTDDDGRLCSYENEQDFSNPLDDHTRHPEWPDCLAAMHQDRMMSESFASLLERHARDGQEVVIDVISYGWVSDTYAHLQLCSIDDQGADYEFRFSKDLPQRIRLRPIFLFLFDGRYPKYYHCKVIK